MKMFEKIFKTNNEPDNLLDQLNEVLTPLLGSEYRKLGSAFNCPPTEGFSDYLVSETYKEVGTLFHEAAMERGEKLSAGIKNRIVWIFIIKRELEGDLAYRSYLDSEIINYLEKGLREEFQNELILFGLNPHE